MAERLPPGYGVLVTRPPDQAAELAEAIRQAGGEPILFPVLAIEARPADDVAAEAAALPPADITVFISRNAVGHGLRWASGRLAAIGPTTAAELERRGRPVDICPSAGFDSESLLAEPAFAGVAGKTVRIIRGNAGRELLGDELRERGARVDYLATYRRRLPELAESDRERLAARWRAGDVQAIIVMSSESLANLDRLLPPDCRPSAAGPLLVTPAARVLKEAEQRYPGSPVAQAAGPRVSDLVACIAARAGRPASPPPQPD